MTVDFRTKNALLLAKVEAVPGTEEAPVPGTDAIRIRDQVAWSATLDSMTTGYVQETISESAPIIGGGGAGIRLPVWMTGCTAPGTTGPDWGKLMLGCAFSEVKLAAAHTGTSTATTASTITLAAGASAVDDAYIGMPIDGTSGTISGQRRYISDYVGSTKVATVAPDWTGSPTGALGYNIPPCAVYIPITLSQKTLTLFGYQHDSVLANTSRLRKVKGAMGNGTISGQPKGLFGINFDFQGQLPAAPTDVTRPAAATYVGHEPQPYLNAVSSLGGTAIKFNDFSLDFGNRITQYDDPAQALGRDTSEATARVMSGRIVPCLTHIATRDTFTDFMNSVSRSLVLSWGSAVGKKIAIFAPALRFTGNEPSDANGYQVEGIPFRAVGNDGEVYISIS